jgi:hypothetical protein
MSRPAQFLSDTCHLLEKPLHDVPTFAKLATDLENAVNGSLQLENLDFYCGLDTSTAELGAVRSGTRQTSVDPLSESSLPM